MLTVFKTRLALTGGLAVLLGIGAIMNSKMNAQGPTDGVAAAPRMSAMGELARSAAQGHNLSSPAEMQDDVDRISAASLQSETAIAVDPTGRHVVVGFNDFRGLQSVSKVSISGFAYSDDGGKTWIDGGQLPTPANDTLFGQKFPQIFGDPDVKYLGGCTFIYSSLMVKKSGSGLVQTLSLHRSTDCGHTWSGPFEIAAATNPNGHVDVNGNGEDEADKEMMAVDPDTGRVIVTWANFTPLAPAGVEISTAYSDDVLTATPPTWSIRRIVANGRTDGQSPVARCAGNGSAKAYLAWTQFKNAYQEGIAFAVSNDNGATWGPPVGVAPGFTVADEVLGNDRINSFPSLSVDNSPGPYKGNVYLTFSNNNAKDGADVVFLRSTDGGSTFLPPIVLNSRPGADRSQWFPSVAADTITGRVFVAYYDQGIATSGDLTEVTYVYSDDGGSSWSKPVPLSRRPFHAGYGNDTNEPNLGDYNEVVAQGNELFAAWAGNPPLVNFEDGEPLNVLTVPDVYLNQKVVFKKVSASQSQAAIRLGNVAFTDSGGDGHINAGEAVELNVPLENYVTNPLSQEIVRGVTATLSTSTPGVTVVLANGTYANIEPGGSSSNRMPYRFLVAPMFVPGTRIELVLDVQTSRGRAVLPFTLQTGTPVETTLLTENFNAVAPGTLPAGWTAAHGAGLNVVRWTTSNTFCGTKSNAAFHQNQNDGPTGRSPSRWERLLSPSVRVPATAEYVTIDFDVCYDTEDDPVLNVLAYDGLFLRIADVTPGRTLRSVLAEAFAEEFVTGQVETYPKHLPSSADPSYFGDMSAWAGASQGFQHVRMKLPGMAGSTFQLRFEYTQDSSFTCANVRPGSSCGVMVDNILVKSVTSR